MARNGRPRRALVAGAAGFIGSQLCDSLLAEGWAVIGIDNFLTGRLENVNHLDREPRFSLVNADIINPLPQSARVEVIFNLACAASPPHYQADPIHTMMTSVVGTRNLLAHAADSGARFVLASTSEVYGDPEVHPQTESYFGNVNPTGPRACYDEGKRAAESLSFDYQRAGRVNVRVARIFNTYGPRMRSDDGRVISNMITQALNGDDITIYGDGSQSRSFCYAEDLVDGLVRLASRNACVPGPVNLGNPVELTIMELANLVRRLTGSKSRVVNMPLPADDPRRRKPDITLAKDLLGWQPRTPLETGLRRTITWFASNRGLSRAETLRAKNGKQARAVKPLDMVSMELP